MVAKNHNSVKFDPFADFAEIYELTHSEKGDDLNFYLEYAKLAGSPILEVGSGTGRVTLKLAEAGHTVYGIDLSENMLKIAREKIKLFPEEFQKRIILEQQDMCELNFPGCKFPLALMPYGEFAHVLERPRQIAALEAINRHLNKDGLLIIGMSNWDAQEERISIKGNEITQWGHSMPVKYEGIFEDKKNRRMITRYIARGYDPSVQTAIHVYVHEITDNEGRLLAKKTNAIPLRYIFRYEMELLLDKTGFVTENIFGFFDKSEFTFNSKRMIFVARKVSD